MAIFSTSSVVGGISGNLGGGCFVNGKGSKVLRKSKRITKSRSNTLTENRARFATFQRRWRTLSVDQRTAWRTYANNKPFTNRLGVSTTLSGFQTFVKIQLNLVDELGFFSDDPPVSADQSIQAPISVSSTVSGGMLLELPAYPSSVFTQIRIKGKLLYTDSIPKFWDTYNHIELLEFFAPLSPIDINFTLSWENVFPLPVLNQVVAFRLSYASSDHVEWGRFDQIIKTSA